MIDITNWDEVRPHIHDRLLSAALCYRVPGLVQENAAGDVWRTWYVDIGDHKLVPVTEALAQTWGVSCDDLAAAADENADPAVVAMPDVLGVRDSACIPMYVITTKQGIYGASAILNRDVQARLSCIFRDGYLILPSSIHEVIAVGAGGFLTTQGAAEMVREVNANIVSDDDKLSDHVFIIQDGRLAVAA